MLCLQCIFSACNAISCCHILSAVSSSTKNGETCCGAGRREQPPSKARIASGNQPASTNRNPTLLLLHVYLTFSTSPRARLHCITTLFEKSLIVCKIYRPVIKAQLFSQNCSFLKEMSCLCRNIAFTHKSRYLHVFKIK